MPEGQTFIDFRDFRNQNVVPPNVAVAEQRIGKSFSRLDDHFAHRCLNGIVVAEVAHGLRADKQDVHFLHVLTHGDGVILFEVVDMATRFINDTTLADMRSLVVSTLPAAVANVAE